MCVTYDGSRDFANGMKFYLDGSTVSQTVTVEPPASGTIPYNNSSAYIADTPEITFTAGEDDCFLDEISFWNTELSSTDVSNIYNSGSPNDLSTHAQSANLEAWFRFDGDTIDSGNTCNDKQGNHDGTYHTTISSPNESTNVP